MKKFIIAAALLATCTAVAEAKCGTNQLNGKWFSFVPGEEVQKLIILDGTITPEGGGSFSAQIQQNEKCRVKLTSSGITGVGTSEAIPAGSGRKPRLLSVSVLNPEPRLITLVRR